MPLTDTQLAELRNEPVGPSGNRLAKAIELIGLKQAVIAAGIGATQQYVSDVSRGKFSTITVDNARKFTTFFGCTIDDLFPSKEAVAQ